MYLSLKHRGGFYFPYCCILCCCWGDRDDRWVPVSGERKSEADLGLRRTVVTGILSVRGLKIRNFKIGPAQWPARQGTCTSEVARGLLRCLSAPPAPAEEQGSVPSTPLAGHNAHNSSFRGADTLLAMVAPVYLQCTYR